jgi:hypothetical protein
MTRTNDAGGLAGLLATLESAWRETGAPNLPHLRPGLSEDALSAALTGAGLPAIPDLQTWFGWHDGAHNPDLSEDLKHLFTPGDANRFLDDWYLLTLSQALDDRREALEVESGLGLDPPLYRRGWLTVLRHTSSASACVDLTGEAGSVGTLFLYDPHGRQPPEPAEPWFAGLSALVSAANEAMSTGAVAPDLQISDPDALPQAAKPFWY